MLVDEDGLVNLDLTLNLIEANPDILIYSFNNRSVMQPIIEQPYNAILKLILGNIIPYGYARGIDNPRMITQHICRKQILILLPFISYFFLVSSVKN